MMNNNLDDIWNEIESSMKDEDQFCIRLIYIDLLYRVFAGVSGIPYRRSLSIEIPQDQIDKFSSFRMPQGINMTIEKPGIVHEGFNSCMIQAASSDQNDVFTIVATDILEELRKQKNKDNYIETLKNRIEKWRYFFKNISEKKLSEKEVIGLFGELSFIEYMQDKGVGEVINYWNGPIKSAQDFRTERYAVEVKTAISSSIESVHVSSEIQLDDSELEHLFLTIFRLEKNNTNGRTLPELVSTIASRLSEQQSKLFFAKLVCLNYSDNDKDLYPQRFCVKEMKAFRVEEGFPRLVSGDLPEGVNNARYTIMINKCEPFVIDNDKLVSIIKGE